MSKIYNSRLYLKIFSAKDDYKKLSNPSDILYLRAPHAIILKYEQLELQIWLSSFKYIISYFT